MACMSVNGAELSKDMLLHGCIAWAWNRATGVLHNSLHVGNVLLKKTILIECRRRLPLRALNMVERQNFKKIGAKFLFLQIKYESVNRLITYSLVLH